MTVTFYDSTTDTREHIGVVQRYLELVIAHLRERSASHDRSKLEEPEKSVFDIYSPKLRDTTYGSDEYKRYLAEMQTALDHHYAENSHHPEFYGDGISGMTLLDLIEMLCDWKAATERHADGDLIRSIKQNQERFGYSDEMRQILLNTAFELWGLR